MVGGLVVSQALTLFTTPVVYLYLDTFSNAIVALDQQQEAGEMPEARDRRDQARCGMNGTSSAHPLQHQRLQPRGEGGGILRQFAVEDLRLLQQQQRQIVRFCLVAALARDRRHQRMAQIDLEDRLGRARRGSAATASAPARGRALAAGDEAGGAGGEPGRGLHVGDAVAEACLDDRDRRGLVGGGLPALSFSCSSSSGIRSKLRSPWLSDFSGLPSNSSRAEVQKASTASVKQQHLDAARGGRLQPRIGFQPLDAVADQESRFRSGSA